MRILLLLTLLSVTLLSCEQEVYRVDLLQNNSKEIFFKLEKEEVINLYADIDIEYKEKPSFIYHCEFNQGGGMLFEGGTDPLITTENKDESIVIKNGITHWRFYGKLDGNLTATMNGEYSIKTTFLKNKEPNLKINKVDIVLVKQ